MSAIHPAPLQVRDTFETRRLLKTHHAMLPFPCYKSFASQPSIMPQTRNPQPSITHIPLRT